MEALPHPQGIKEAGPEEQGAMNEDYSQLFSVIASKGKFRYARNGYVPALQLPDTEVTTIDWQRVSDADYRRLQVLVLDLQNRINKHIDHSKRQDRL